MATWYEKLFSAASAVVDYLLTPSPTSHASYPPANELKVDHLRHDMRIHSLLSKTKKLFDSRRSSPEAILTEFNNNDHMLFGVERTSAPLKALYFGP